MKWYLMQLFPFKYDTVYEEDGVKKVAIWNMFLGRCYNIREYIVK